MKRRPSGARNWKHGYADSRTYKIWQMMRDRCQNPRSTGFENYGGRGIRVCERWRDFVAFLADMGEAPPGLTIERKDNDGHYEPGNCRWATRSEQNNNSRGNNRLTYDGITDTVVGWSKRLGCKTQVLRVRLHQGWPLSHVLSGPFDQHRPKRKSQRYPWQGERLTIPQLAERTGIPRTTLGMRLRSGWTLEDAVTKPVRGR